MIRKRIVMFSFGFVCLALCIALAVHLSITPKASYHPPTTIVATPFSGKQKLHKFYLYATDGNIFTEKSLRGHWTLMFFGYTKCPDICPRTLGILRDAWNTFANSKQKAPARFVFADISTESVPLAELKQFVQNYNQEFIGVHGSLEQMHQLSDQLGIYYTRQQQNIDHTSSLMLIDPQGILRATFTPPFTADDIVHDLTVLTL